MWSLLDWCRGGRVRWQTGQLHLLPISIGLQCGQDLGRLQDRMPMRQHSTGGGGTLMNLLRCMFFMASHCSVQVHATHIPGNAADALSPRLFCRLSRKTPHQFLKLFWTWQSRNSHTGPSCGGHDSSVLSEGGTSPVNPARIPVFQEQISCLLPKCRNSIPTHFGG